MMYQTNKIYTVEKKISIYTTNIGDPFNLSKVISRYRKNNPITSESNVKAWHKIIDSSSLEEGFQESVKTITNFCDRISEEIYNCPFVKHSCCNMWIMDYDCGEYAVEHNHYPADYSCVYYIDVDEDSSPLIVENDLEIFPENGMLVVLPGEINHRVAPTKSKRVAMAMNVIKNFIS